MRPGQCGAATIAAVLLATILAFAVACTPATGPGPSAPTGPTHGIAGSTPPSAVTGSSPSGHAASVTTAEAAAALVIPADPRFAGIGPFDPNVIGACCSWTALPTADGWTVTIEIGWGDCPAGCIERHHWIYSVTTAGVVTLAAEDGPPVPAGIRAPGGDQTGHVGIRGIASDGSVCPVERPNDAACAARPVVGATVHVLDATGTEVAVLETDPAGAFWVTLPPGRYQIRADPVEGLIGTPAPIEVDVTTALAPVHLAYDSGMR